MTEVVGRPADPPADDSLAALFDRYSRPALTLATRILRDEGLAEDIVQEVFLALRRRPTAFDPARGSLSGWLMAMVHHKAVDAVRREQGHRRHLVPADPQTALARAGTASDVAALACDRVAQAPVTAALLALPAAQREALVLAYGRATARRRSPSAPALRWARSRPAWPRGCAASSSTWTARSGTV